MIAENRRLGQTAFMQLPRATQYVLWHTLVEAEPLNLTAARFGMEIGVARAELDQAREQIRLAVLRAHIEGSADSRCRNYSRLLDATVRRGGSLLPEAQLHLQDCPFCQNTAEQLRSFSAEPGVLLAQSLLGRHAEAYLVACRKRRQRNAVVGPTGEETRDRQFRSVHAAENAPKGKTIAALCSSPRVFAFGIAVSSAVVAMALFTAVSRSDKATEPTDTRPVPAAPSSPIAPSAKPPLTPQAGGLRNAAANLCMDIRGGVARRGADITLSVCSSAARTQRWTYDEDGLLRNFAQPDLCLDAGGDDEGVDLERCDSSGNGSFGLRFKLTRDGELLVRDEDNLAVAPASPDAGAVVLGVSRNGLAAQRWLVEAGA
ncbi:RICIN domain-containing protein [Streptomyces umbrinus]|uniref:RICIN domain-containing protein n=1 Tax=Streptomyces umbrinus TaxID=67370 RepID=UPI0033DBEC19